MVIHVGLSINSTVIGNTYIKSLLCDRDMWDSTHIISPNDINFEVSGRVPLNTKHCQIY